MDGIYMVYTRHIPKIGVPDVEILAFSYKGTVLYDSVSADTVTYPMHTVTYYPGQNEKKTEFGIGHSIY